MTEYQQRLLAEGVGTAFLLATVVGSGIMGERLAAGNAAMALLANSIATGAGLLAILLALGPVSGAHLNPAVSVVMAVRGELAWHDVPGYVLAQLIGAVYGVWAAHAMFALPLLQLAETARPGLNLVWSEFVATAGLLGVVLLCSRQRAAVVPFAVAAYIAAAYWFTASTSFANPAVTIARSLTDTFTGIGMMHVPGFLAGQFAAGLMVVTVLHHQRQRYAALDKRTHSTVG